MCGFLGVGGKSFYENKIGDIYSAFNWLKHRGPDETKTKIMGEFFIGFHRLAIVGVEDKESSQPIKLKRKSIDMLFNGEIFNYKNIANEKLKDSSINFRSDTMVLSELIDIYGFNCLQYLDGMFSIALINFAQNKVTLIRDRYGIKPLYYSFINGNIIFSSHIKPITEILNQKKANSDVIFTYLNSGLYDHSEQTFFEGVYSVPPGHIIEFDIKNKSFNKTKWYEIENHLEIKNRKNYNDLIEEVDETITNVIKDYIPLEVDFAVNVSGGVDSTLVVDNINKLCSHKFLLQNQDYISPYSEKKWIKKYSEILNLNPKYHLISPDDIVKDLFSTFEYQFQPFGGVTIPGYSKLYNHANEKNCKVILDGTGLDEAFLGYPRYGKNSFHNKSQFWKESLKGSSGPTDKKGIRPNVISENLSKNSKKIKPYNNNLKNIHNLDSARLNSLLDLINNKIPRTTRFSDHASSRYSLELRTPFLSHKIIHLGCSISSSYLISNKGTKLVIRDLLDKKGLGEIGYAPKRYIQSPQNNWLAKELKPLVKKYIFSDNFFDMGWVKPEEVKKEYEYYLKSNRSNSFFIWQWLSLAIWSEFIIQ